MNLKNVFPVGGCVRDQLMGLKPNDIDYVVIGETIEKMIELGFEQVGKDFPVFLHPETKDEWALARTEKKVAAGYEGFETFFSPEVTLEDDLARRDLTINAMAMSESGEIIDPFGGQEDIKSKVLRHTTEAFIEDPLRVLRVARFLARFGPEWTIHPSTMELMHEIRQSGELETLTPERVWKEMTKALSENHPNLFFETLNGFGLFPEIEAMNGVSQPPEHHPEGDVFVHTMLVVKRAAELNLSLEGRFAALCHDFGKPVTFNEVGNLHGHEQAGVPVVKAFCERLKAPNSFRDLAMLTSDHHTRCHKAKVMKPAKVFSLIIEKMNAEVHPERFEEFLMACQADAQGRAGDFARRPYVEADFLREIFTALKSLDKKELVKSLMEKEVKGKALGEAIRTAQIKIVREKIRTLKN